MVGASTSSGEADGADAGTTAEARRDEVDARGWGCGARWLLRWPLRACPEAARVEVAAVGAGAMCTGGACLVVSFWGGVAAGADDSGSVAGTATDALALLEALTSASNDGSPSRLCSAAFSAACSCLVLFGVSGRLGAGLGDVGVGVAALVVVLAVVASVAEDVEDASVLSEGPSSLLEVADDDVRRSACNRASLARA